MERLRQHPQVSYERLSQRMMLCLVGLILAICTVVAISNLTDQPKIAQPPQTPIVAEREIYLWSDISGKAQVTDAEGIVIAEFTKTEGGFVSTIDRVIERRRLQAGVDPDAALLLRQRENNRVSLFDPSTGRETELVSFGKDNVRDFVQLLTADTLS